MGAISRGPDGPAWSQTLACVDALCAGTGRSHDRPFGNCRRSASGRRGAVADDARSREVRLRHSSWEADEQSGPDRSGAGGAKGGGRGECEPAKHGPGTEPDNRVTDAGAHAVSRKISVSPSSTQGWSRMPELGTYGSGRGARGNSRPYRDRVGTGQITRTRRFFGPLKFSETRKSVAQIERPRVPRKRTKSRKAALISLPANRASGWSGDCQ